MVKRLVSTVTFWVLETAIILASIVVVFCFYLPFVALKAVWVGLRTAAKGRPGAAAGS
jgi:hypothetical protein